MTDIHPEFHDFAFAATVATCRRYGRFVEQDDCYQEMVVYYLRNKGECDELIAPPPDEGQEEPSRQVVAAAHRRLARRLAKAGERYARKTRAQQLGYETGDEYFYTRNTVETLLPLALSETDAALMPQHETHPGRRIATQPDEGNNLPVLVADVSSAVSRLDEDQQNLLESVFLPTRGRTVSEMREAVASREGVSRWAIDGRINRIIDRIVTQLGGPNPYERSRPVSTAHAVAITRRQEEG